MAEDGIYVLEVNTLPGLTKESLFPKAAAVVGCSFDQLLNHLLTLALEEKGRIAQWWSRVLIRPRFLVRSQVRPHHEGNRGASDV